MRRLPQKLGTFSLEKKRLGGESNQGPAVSRSTPLSRTFSRDKFTFAALGDHKKTEKITGPAIFWLLRGKHHFPISFCLKSLLFLPFPNDRQSRGKNNIKKRKIIIKKIKSGAFLACPSWLQAIRVG